jgi:hypothetical protein
MKIFNYKMSVDMTFISDLDNVDQDHVFSGTDHFEHSNFLIKITYHGMKINFHSGVTSISSSEIKDFLYKIENNFGSSNISFNSNNGSILSCDSNGNFHLEVYTCKECCFTALSINIILDQQSFINFLNVIRLLLNFSEKYENLRFDDEDYDSNNETPEEDEETNDE